MAKLNYNGQWYEPEELYDSFGITPNPATEVILYDGELNTYNARDYEGNTFVVENNATGEGQWYTQEELPYYRKTDYKEDFYLVETLLSLDVYIYHATGKFYLYKGKLYSQQSLHDSFGITVTPSSYYSVKDGQVESWYNDDENKYWIVADNTWSPNPPSGDTPVDDIDSVGSMGIFMFTGGPANYGALVSSNFLQPMCMNLSTAGKVTYTGTTNTLTGTWRLMTAVISSSLKNPCMVFAVKTSNEESNFSGSSTQSLYSPISNSISYTEYNL